MLRWSSARGALAITLGAVALCPPAFAQRHELAKLLAHDGSANDGFGVAVAIGEEVALVGAYGDWVSGYFSGSAYLFDARTGEELSKFVPADGDWVDEFGHSAAIEGHIAIIGAPLVDDGGHDTGAAYLFDISDPTTARELAKIVPSDGAGGEQFGYKVALSGTIAVIPAYRDDDNGERSGSVYLFDISDPRNPVLTMKLLPADGEAMDEFGFAVAISGRIVLVGVPSDDNERGVNAGAVYLFDTATGAQLGKLVADDGEPSDAFGYSVAISSGRALITAPSDDDRGEDAGTAYLFNVASGELIAKLLARDGGGGDRFGQSGAMDGDTAVIGARLIPDGGPLSGSAYIFDAATGAQLGKLLPSDGTASISFGITGAMRGSRAIIGAWLDDDNGEISGSAYLFGVCGPDINGDGGLDTRDVLAYFNLWAARRPDADWDGDGDIDDSDVAAFLDAWLVGCA